MNWTKLFNLKNFAGPYWALISPFSEITLDAGGKLTIGNSFKMRDGAKLRVRKNATLKIGDRVSINSNNIIACHDSITIGDDVIFSPNVQIYDHDHDYNAPNGLKENRYVTSPVFIGNNVWIGANAIILRGSDIGDNCVIAAGSIVKGKVDSGTVFIQKRG